MHTHWQMACCSVHGSSSPLVQLFSTIIYYAPHTKHKTSVLQLHTNHLVKNIRTHTRTTTHTHVHIHIHIHTHSQHYTLQPFQLPSRCFVSPAYFVRLNDCMISHSPAISPSLCDSFSPATYHRRVGGQ